MIRKHNNKIGRLKIAFFGSPEFSAQLLEMILTKAIDSTQVCLVVTQPDRPAGRGMALTPTNVKIIAQKYCIPVYDATLQRGNDGLERLLHEHMIDIAFVYAYNEMIPEHILSMPPLGFWNIHPSLLPKYRGASPIVFPIALHEQKTGVSLMRMERKMDAGPILYQKEISIETEDTQSSLQEELTHLGFGLIQDMVASIEKGEKLSPYVQNDKDTTYTFKLERGDGYIDLHDLKTVITGSKIRSSSIALYKKYGDKNPAHKFQNAISLDDIFYVWKALSPWPGVWTIVPTTHGNKRLKIIHMTYVAGKARLQKVQLEGKSATDLEIFLKAYPQVFN